jgi:hypothetical protein
VIYKHRRPVTGGGRRGSASFALTVVLCLGIAPRLKAAFQDLDLGARPVGMGGAFSAVADDSNAPLYNPAGIVQIQWNELAATYSNLYSGLTLYSGNDTSQLNQGYFAFAAKPIPHVGSLEISWANFNVTHLYREDTFALTYARNLGDFIPQLDNALSLGTNLKYLRHSVSLDEATANDPVFSGGDSASALTFDLGVLYHPNEGRLAGLRLALVGENLTRPNIGFREEDRVPIETRFGIAYQTPNVPWLVPSLDISRRDGVTGVAAGVESWLFHNMLGLRGGVNRDEASAGISFYQALGKRYGLRLDYGFTIPFFIEGSGGSHRLALALYF